MSGRIEKEFEAFVAACFGEAGSQQRLYLRLAFYAGAISFTVLMSEAPKGESDEGVASAIQAELLRFNEDVKAGRA